MDAHLLAINAHYCVMVIVRAVVWLIVPVPIVEAVRVTVLVPGEVPTFLVLPHEAKLAANNT